MSEWETYFKKHASRQPREQLIRAVSFCSSKGEALDLGAGTLVESAFLLQEGFSHVTAVDSSPQSIEFAKHLDPEKFTLKTESFADFILTPNTYDLIDAQFALPFHGPENFESFIKNIIDSLKHGGIFVGQFFGVRDEWNVPGKKMAFQTKEEVTDLLSNLETIEFIEEEKDGQTAAGNMKHWHVFNFIVRKI